MMDLGENMAYNIYLYSDNHVLWAWNTKAVPMNYLDTKAVPKRKFFKCKSHKEAISFFVAHTPVIKNEDLWGKVLKSLRLQFKLSH